MWPPALCNNGIVVMQIRLIRIILIVAIIVAVVLGRISRRGRLLFNIGFLSLPERTRPAILRFS